MLIEPTVRELGVTIIEPTIRELGVTINISPSWGQCVRLEFDLGRHDDTMDASSRFSLCLYDLSKVDKLIADLTYARNEIERIKCMIQN